MSQDKRSTEGSSIWVESLLNAEEYREAARKYPEAFTKGPVAPSYNPVYYKGGKWKANMGRGYSSEEIRIFNKRIDDLGEMISRARELAEKAKKEEQL